MAEKLCELRKKGGGGAKYTETSLWTNPSPTSGFPASGSSVDITLSESMANYKYIKIKYVRGTSSPYSSQYSSVEYLSEDLLAFDSSGGAFRGSLGHLDTSTTAQYSRLFMTVNNTTLRFYLVYKQGATNSYNSTVIPVEILGLNELAHGTVQTATGTCERGASPVTVNLGFRPSFVSIYKTNASSSGTSTGDSLFVADTGFSTSYALSAYKESSGSTFTKVAMNNYITITDTGFTFALSSTATFRGTYRYVAIGSTTE